MTNPEQVRAAFWHLVEGLESIDRLRSDAPLLAHYTSIQNVESILRSDELWFSNPLLMNDYEEMRFGVYEGARIFHTLFDTCQTFCSTAAWKAIRERFDLELSALERLDAADIYVLCFSEHPKGNIDGILSMWRGYGARGSGAALVFDSQPLAESDDEHPITIHKVTYGTRDQRTSHISRVLCEWAATCRRVSVDEATAEFAVAVAFRMILLISLTWKHDGYREENEWRAIYYGRGDRAGLLHKHMSYSIQGGVISPRFKFKVAPLSNTTNQNITLRSLLHAILLGPAASSDLAIAGAKRMLKEMGKEYLCDRIVASGIPYRERQG